MAILPMADAVPGQVALASEYNRVTANIRDLYDLLGNGVSGSATVTDQLITLESRTTNTTTNGGYGNARLADRLGTGVGTGTNVTTGNATSQLGSLRTRATALETLTGGPSNGNAALGSRVSALEASVGANPIYGQFTMAAGFAMPAAGWNKVPLDTAMFNEGFTFNTSTNRVICITPGVYELGGHAAWSTHASTSNRLTSVRKNGTDVEGAFMSIAPTPGNTVAYASAPIFVALAEGDYLEYWANAAEGVVIRGPGGGTASLLSLKRIA